MIEDNNNIDNRVLTCDNVDTTITKYEYPKGSTNFVKSFENDYCVVECRENIALSFDGIKRVYAGMSFTYPLNLSAKRSCRSTNKNVQNFDSIYRTMVNSYMVLGGYKTDGTPRADINDDGKFNNADVAYVNSLVNSLLTLDGRRVLDLDRNNVVDANAVDTLYNAINYMKTQKSSCDDWKSLADSKYIVNPEVNLNITTSKGIVSKKFDYVEALPYTSTVTNDSSNYFSCLLSEKLVSGFRELNCKDELTIIGWTEIASITGRYSLPKVDLELYTGKVINEGESSSTKTCSAGERYYTSLKEITRPALNNVIDKGYPLVLSVTGIGNNVDKTVSKNLNLTVNCNYQVRNIASPQVGDSIYELYESYITNKEGLGLYEYRSIDLERPFPDREPLANWNGSVKVLINGKQRDVPLKEYYITKEGKTIRNRNMYTIILNESLVNNIRAYNTSVPYGVFNLDKNEKSVFVESNIQIIQKGD